jgi:N-acetylneuraminic acid mutarotase
MGKELIPFLIVLIVVSMFMSALDFPIVDAAEDSWAPKKPMPTARGGLGVIVLYGKIYAIGGSNNDTQLAVTEEYNPVTDTWVSKSPMPTPRSGFAIAAYQDKIYCIGGTTEDSDFTGITEVYDPATDKWQTQLSMPTPRADLCASVVDGKIYCIGGKKYGGFDPAFYQELDLTEVYDPINNSWITKSAIPIPVSGASSSVLDGKIYVVGGSRNLHLGLGFDIVSYNQVYNPENDTWSTRASLPTAKSHAAAAATSNITAPKRIFLVGGTNKTDYSGFTYAYDSGNNVWSTGALMLTPRENLALVVVNDILYAIGGFDGSNWLNVNEQYIPLGYGTVPPELQILSPENTTYTSSDIQLILYVNRDTKRHMYSLDGLANITFTGDIELFNLADGAHNITVYVEDEFENMVSSNVISFYVDTRPPKITVVSPENVTYGERDIQSTFIVNEPVQWMGYSLDGQDNVTVTGNVTLAVLGDGSHNIAFYAIDFVGNSGASETIYFRISPFPTVLIVSIMVTVTIVASVSYLLLIRKKTTKKKGIPI